MTRKRREKETERRETRQRCKILMLAPVQKPEHEDIAWCATEIASTVCQDVR